MSETGSMPEERPDRIVIPPLTQGSLDNRYIKLGEHSSFFPRDSIGGANKQYQARRQLTLHFVGILEPVKTDIDGAGNHFRYRGDIVRRFFNDHGLQPGDQILIEKRSKYEYDIVPYNAGAASSLPVQPGEGSAGHGRGFLRPFKHRAYTDYITHILGGPNRRGRTHEKLVNDFADWLTARDLTVASNAAIDLGLERPPVIIEAKVIRAARWAPAIREAVGQLYEYRYFQVVAPESSLLFLASAEIPRDWLDYLDKDRKIGAAWRTTGGFLLSDRALTVLGLGDS
jgi:hypothetical protein